MPSKQFSSKPEVITYPEMYSLCPGYSLGQRRVEGLVFVHDMQTHEQVEKIRFAQERPGPTQASLGAL